MGYTNRGNAISIVAVIAINVVIFLALALALYTRYITYADYYRWNMPTDTLVFPARHGSPFCSDYTLSTALEDKDVVASNSRPFFDLYESKENPQNTNTSVFRYHLKGTGGLRVRQHRFHHFDLVYGSNISGKICAQWERSTNKTPHVGIWFYVIRGKQNFDVWRKQHRGYEKSPACDQTICLTSRHLNDSTFSQSGQGCSQFQVTSMGSGGPRAHYVVFYFYPYKSNKFDTQEFKINYYLNRKVHNLPQNASRSCYNVAECTADVTKYNILKFNYFSKQDGLDLYNIVTTYSCTPDARVYFAFFFIIPLILVIIISAVAICCARRLQKRSGLLAVSRYGTIPQR